MPSIIRRSGADFTPADLFQQGALRSGAPHLTLIVACENAVPFVPCTRRLRGALLTGALTLAFLSPCASYAQESSTVGEQSPVTNTPTLERLRPSPAPQELAPEMLPTSKTPMQPAPTAVAPGATPRPASPTAVSALEPKTITVLGEREANVGSRLNESLKDVPATVNTVTAQTLKERAVVDLTGALQNVAGVNPILQYGGFTYFTIRGFKDFVVVADGARDDRYFFVESAPTSNLVDIARIDVLKGPASALYGHGGIGGIIYLTRRQPTQALTYSAGVTLGAPRILRRASVGAGGPIGGRGLSYRLDAGIVDDLDFRGAQFESAKASGALQWQSGRHRVLLRSSVTRDRFNTDTGIPTNAAGEVPREIALNRRFNTRFDFLSARSIDASAAYTFQVTDWLQVCYRLSYSYNPYSYASAETLSLGEDSTVNRGWFFLEHHWKPLYTSLDVAFTGKALVEHRVLAGYQFGWLSSEHPRADMSNTDLLPVPYERGLDPQGAYPITLTSRLERTQLTHAVYAHDTLALLPVLKLAVGGRFDAWSFTQETRSLEPGTDRNTGTLATIDRSTAAFTWRAGLVYQPISWATAYGAIATAFQPARQVPADNRQLEPERGQQFELGLRGEFWDGDVRINAAAYELSKTHVVVGRAAGVFEQAGEQRSRGVEVDAGLVPHEGFALRLGYALTHARFVRYQTDDASYSGKRPSNVPEHTLTAWGTYRANNGLGAGLGGRAVSSSYADPANQVVLPAYGVVDAAGYYRFGELELGLNVNNVFGLRRYFVASINDTQLTPGTPRVVLASLRITH